MNTAPQSAALLRILSDIAGRDVSGLAPTTSLVSDLQLDSLDLLELADRIESELGIAFAEDQVRSATLFTTIGELGEHVLAGEQMRG